jgi:hypothetical protein
MCAVTGQHSFLPSVAGCCSDEARFISVSLVCCACEPANHCSTADFYTPSFWTSLAPPCRVENEDREPDPTLLNALESFAPAAVGGNWGAALDVELIANLGRYRRYDYTCLRDLLRVVRNKRNHFREMPDSLQQLMGPLPHAYYRYRSALTGAGRGGASCVGLVPWSSSPRRGGCSYKSFRCDQPLQWMHTAAGPWCRRCAAVAATEGNQEHWELPAHLWLQPTDRQTHRLPLHALPPAGTLAAASPCCCWQSSSSPCRIFQMTPTLPSTSQQEGGRTLAWSPAAAFCPLNAPGTACRQRQSAQATWHFQLAQQQQGRWQTAAWQQ